MWCTPLTRTREPRTSTFILPPQWTSWHRSKDFYIFFVFLRSFFLENRKFCAFNNNIISWFNFGLKFRSEEKQKIILYENFHYLYFIRLLPMPIARSSEIYINIVVIDWVSWDWKIYSSVNRKWKDNFFIFHMDDWNDGRVDVNRIILFSSVKNAYHDFSTLEEVSEISAINWNRRLILPRFSTSSKHIFTSQICSPIFASTSINQRFKTWSCNLLHVEVDIYPSHEKL